MRYSTRPSFTLVRSSNWSSFPVSSCLDFSSSWIWGRKSMILEEKTAVDAFYCIWLRNRNACLLFLVNSAGRRDKLRHGKKIFLVNLWEEAAVLVRHLLINIMSTIICSVCEEDKDYRVDCILLLLFLQFLTPRLPTSREKREWRKRRNKTHFPWAAVLPPGRPSRRRGWGRCRWLAVQGLVASKITLKKNKVTERANQRQHIKIRGSKDNLEKTT